MPTTLRPTDLAVVELLTGSDALAQLRIDLAPPGEVFIYAYRLEVNFLLDLLRLHPADRPARLLVDATEAPKLPALLASSPALAARTWARNRIMHSKCIIFPDQALVHLGSSNLTRYSYQVSHNLVVRVSSKPFASRAHDIALQHWRISDPVPV